MTTITRLEVGIAVRDLDEATHFYQDGIGLPHVSDEDTPFGFLRKFACGPGFFKLMKLKEPPTESNPPGGLQTLSTGLRWFSIVVDDIDGLFERCKARGGRVVEPIYDWSPTLKFGILEDPEGSCWIEVAQRHDGGFPVGRRRRSVRAAVRPA